jgi:hypothetical protein
MPIAVRFLRFSSRTKEFRLTRSKYSTRGHR